jgi:2-oxoisovalerate dehydrogenase E1 component
VPDGYYNIELGKALSICEGNDATIITFGAGVHWAKQLIDEEGLSIDLIDLRSLIPLDKEAIIKSVHKTGKVLLVTEDNLTGSVISDIAAFINEDCFEYLDAPVMRLGSIDTPIPFEKGLEDNYLPVHLLKEKLKKLLDY